MELAPIVSIDWLQLNLIAPRDMDVKYHSFFQVKLMPYSTRHFKIVEELYRHNHRICTITRSPLSNIIAADTILVKFDNWVLYSFPLLEYVNQFISLNNFKFKSISRLDICADFQRFKNGMIPSNFIKNYLNGHYLRLGRTSIGNSHFKQIDTDLFFNALKFGSNLSDISVYLYNKSLEMQTVKWKPWIADLWHKNNFPSNVDTWRLEISIKSSNKVIVNMDTAEMQILNSLDVLKNNYTKLSFDVFREKYFSFVIKSNIKKKTRMKRIVLFSGNYSKYRVIEGDKMIAANRSDKIFINKLEQVNQDLRGSNFNFNVDIDKLKCDYIGITGLQEWAFSRGLLK